MAYLYQQCGMFDRSVALGKEMLQIPDLDETTRDEIYCLLADGCMYQNRMDQAIGWLDRILKESRDSSLIEYTKVTKEAWEGSLE